MRILILTRYSRMGASSRMRALQYLPSLDSEGIDVTVSPLFSDAYVGGLQQGKKSLMEVFSGYSRRLRSLLMSQPFDLFWIEKELLPWMPALVERMLLPKRIPYVLDYDDAVFHYYDLNRNLLVKRLLGSKHLKLIQGAALVMAGNEYLADFARKAGARYVEIVPTVIDLGRYPPAVQESLATKSMPPRIGWIGQRAQAAQLVRYAPLFDRLSSEGKARVIVIGIDAAALGMRMESIPWSEQTEVASLAGLDIGVMPLVDEPFERGKCGYKLIQYMACCLPVVASPVGVNCQLVEHCVNGFLAETPEQWESALNALLVDPGLRQRMGHIGRQKVERNYSLQVAAPRLAAILKAVVSTPAHPVSS